MSILTGIAQLLESPSGVFGLLTLGAISLVTWHSPAVGGTAFVAFCGIVPAILCYAEHKETMASLVNSAPQGPTEGRGKP